MKNKTIKERVDSLVRESIGIDDGTPDLTSLKELEFDSMQFISLIVDIEAEFDIEIDDDDLNMSSLSSIENIYEKVQKKLNEK